MYLVSSEARKDVLTWSAVLKRMIDIVELALEMKESNDQLYPVSLCLQAVLEGEGYGCDSFLWECSGIPFSGR